MQTAWQSTEEDAKAYFSKLHPQSGALADDELDYVAGGCGGYGGYNGRPIIMTAARYPIVLLDNGGYVAYYLHIVWETKRTFPLC